LFPSNRKVLHEIIWNRRYAYCHDNPRRLIGSLG
jgi:hypothetical protein